MVGEIERENGATAEADKKRNRPITFSSQQILLSPPFS